MSEEVDSQIAASGSGESDAREERNAGRVVEVRGTNRQSSTSSMSFEEVVIIAEDGRGCGSNAVPFDDFAASVGIQVEWKADGTVILRVPEKFRGKIYQRSGVFSKGHYETTERLLYPKEVC